MEPSRLFDLLYGRPENLDLPEVCRMVYVRFHDGSADSDGISLEMFVRMCSTLFTSEPEQSNLGSTSAEVAALAFSVYDEDGDGLLNREEFSCCYSSWIKKILCPKVCLIVVDVQNDFIDGTLALKNAEAQQDGKEVVPLINGLLRELHFDMVAYSMDWHPKDHCSFVENIACQDVHPNSPFKPDRAQPFDTVLLNGDPPMELMLFPSHCIQGTLGAELHPDLLVGGGHGAAHLILKKGTDSEKECFSAFGLNSKKASTPLYGILKDTSVTDVYVCGLALDFCVGSTALDAIQLGFRTVIVEDATRGCGLKRMEQMRKRFLASGGDFVRANQVASMLLGRTRLPSMGRQLLLPHLQK